MEPVRRNQWLLLGTLFLFCAGVWSAVYAEPAAGNGYLTLAVLDVGQGDALYIESPTGVQILVDGGPGDALLAALPEMMPALDRSLDAVIETHPDADHVGGFAELLQRYEVGVYLSPGIPKDTATNHALKRTVEERDIRHVVARRGMALDLGGGASLRVLYPDYDVSNLPAEKANEGGIVLELAYGESEALLMADVGSGVEKRLLSLNAAQLDADVLKVGHHGSRFSTSEAFVSAVSPAAALISVGAKNSYGHPTKEVLDRLAAHGIKIVRTDQEGTIVCTSDSLQFTCE